MDRDSWSRAPWDVDPRFTAQATVSSYSLQSLVKKAADLQTRLDAAQLLLLKRGMFEQDEASQAA